MQVLTVCNRFDVAIQELLIDLMFLWSSNYNAILFSV